MTTLLFLRDAASSLGGAGQKLLSERRGRTVNGVSATTTTTAGGTDIPVTATGGGQALTWFSEPFTEAVTITTTVGVNIRGREAANTVNAGRGVLIERCNNAGTVLSTILANTTVPAAITEYTTTDAISPANFTPTSTAMAVGERIKVTLKVRNVGTMGANAAGVVNTYDGPAALGAGDTYVSFSTNFRTDQPLDTRAFEIAGSNAYYG